MPRSAARHLCRLFLIYLLRQLLDKVGQAVGKGNALHGVVICPELVPEMCSNLTTEGSALQQRRSCLEHDLDSVTL